MKEQEKSTADRKLMMTNYGWDVAEHLTEEDKEDLLANIPDFQHDMRTRGLPIVGQGRVYPLERKEVVCDPIEIPAHWPRICAMDIGVTHNNAAVWSAQDPATGKIYIYDEYISSGENSTPELNTIQINKRGNWIPVILPHDSDNIERGSGMNVKQYYQAAGCNVQFDSFHNPITVDGKKNNLVEPGLMKILQMMRNGEFKIFSTCSHVLDEFDQYHRKDGKIAKIRDDAIDAMRYSAMSLLANRGKSAMESNSYNDHNDNAIGFDFDNY